MSSQDEIDAINALVEFNESVQERNFASMSQFFDHLFAVFSTNFKQELRPDSVEANYTGIHLSRNYEVGDFQRMIDSFRNGQKIHAKYALQVIEDAIKIFETYPNVLECNLNNGYLAGSAGIVVVGDLHGSFKDLYYIISKFGIPGFNYCFVFNGDFVDRGPQQIEVLITLLYAFLMNPGKVFLNRGNHEDLSINLNPNFTPNFKKDTENKFGKYGLAVFNQSQRLFRRLPLATIVQNISGLRYFVAHGGLSNRLDLDYIKSRQLNRFQFANVTINNREAPNVIKMAEQLSDLLWSAPGRSTNGCQANYHRGIGFIFGADVSENFCRKYGFNAVIRSHECRDNGVTQDHPYCFTVFSSSRYCGGSNNAAVIVIDANGTNLQFKTFNMTPLNPDHHQNEKHLIIQGLKTYLRREVNELLSKFRQSDYQSIGYLNIDLWAKIITDHIYSKTSINIDPKHIVTIKDYLCPCNDANYTAEYGSLFKSTSSQNNYQQLEFIKILFSLIDANGSGSINRSEAEQAVRLINKTFGTSYPASFITSMDTNQDGRVDLSEFYNSFTRTFNF